MLDILRMLVTVVLVLVALVVTLRVVGRNAGGGGGRGGVLSLRRRPQAPARLEVVERVTLSRSASVVLVRVGTRFVALAVNEQGIAVVAEVDPDELDPLDLRDGGFEARCEEAAVGAPGRARRPAGEHGEGGEHGARGERRGASGDATVAADAPVGRATMPFTSALAEAWAQHRRPSGTAKERRPAGSGWWRGPLLVVAVVVGAMAFVAATASDAGAQEDPPTATTVAPNEAPAEGVPGVPGVPAVPQTPAEVTPDQPEPADPADPVLRLDIPTGEDGSATQPLTIIILLTVIALAPAMLALMTSFTRIIIVLGLTRNAIGLQGVPPNQVLIGLSLFLTLFIMGPTLGQVNDEAIQPFLAGDIDQATAYDEGIEPMREFMFSQVRDEDLALFARLADEERPENSDDIGIATLVPAFALSELRAGFLIGFVVFVPFVVIDLVTSAALMSMGMVMVPPVVISLPFKLLLFVLVDGWALTVSTLVESFLA